MVTRRLLVRLAVVPLVAGAGLVGPVAPGAVAAPVAATSADELYVSKRYCAPAGPADGSMDAPFCTISAAVSVVQPGQTVLVQAGSYPENVVIDRSGTEGAPITIRAVNSPDGYVRVGSSGSTPTTGVVFALADVHDVVLAGFRVTPPSGAEAVAVDRSSRVTLDGLSVAGAAQTAIRVSGPAEDVTVSRTFVENYGLSIGPGVVDATVTASQFMTRGVVATDAPGLTLTGNTVSTSCRQGIQINGTSPGASIRNNIVRTNGSHLACTNPANAVAVTVAAGSVPQTVADHNLIDPLTARVLYRWADVDHPDLPSFQQSTGQGAHDIAADPKTYIVNDGNANGRPMFGLAYDSPAIDSADDNAPGANRRDMLGNPHVDDPDQPNPGAGFRDRGAVERLGGTPIATVALRRATGGGLFDTVASQTTTFGRPTDGSLGQVAYRFAPERFWRVTDAASLAHTYRRAGRVCAEIKVNYDDFRVGYGGGTRCTVLGARYNPVTPTRVLDTRTGNGIPVPGNSEIVLSLPQVGGVSVADVSAVVLNVTVTQPTTAGVLRVYPDGAELPEVSNVNFVARETVPNLVTVPMSNGRLRIRNTGGGTVHVVADLQGFYAAAGSGFRSVVPTRVLDTRNAGQKSLAPLSSRVLDLSGRIPVGATAVAVNVTVTQPNAAGVVTVYPYGAAAPLASNLNFVARQTIPNLVVVPVVDRKVVIRNQSSGSTHVVADLAGWFGGGATDLFVPSGPHRAFDSRLAAGPMAPWTHWGFQIRYEKPTDDVAPLPTAVVGNLTVTAPTAAGFLVARPNGADVPNASHVNFLAGETAANLVMVQTRGDELVVHNGSVGRTHFILDQSGYFIAGP